MNICDTPTKQSSRAKLPIKDSPLSQTSTSCHSDHCLEDLTSCEMAWPANYQGAHPQMLLPNNSNSRNPKLKNELCRNYIRLGYCPYNNKCQFAHGAQELRQCQDHLNSKYKTKRCFAFFNNGSCEYGQRCNFLHVAARQNESQKWKQIYRNYRQLMAQAKPQSRLFPNPIEPVGEQQ